MSNNTKTKHPNSTHGMRKTKEYNTWAQMNKRCHNQRDKDYPRYGAKGITVYSPWRKNFMEFFDHVGYAPTDDHQIDRIDTKGNYEPDNVKWSTRSQQCRNRTTSYDWFIKGKEFPSITEAAKFFNVAEQTIHKWVRGCHDHRRGTFTKPRKDCYTTKRYEGEEE